MARTSARRSAAEGFMALAIAEAKRGLGRTSPNPAVGAVVVKGGRVVGRGFHARAGGPHAEVIALKRAGAKARGADLYTTLEPCNHFGRTPPCTEAILRAGIRRVFVGSRDPNPTVVGGGARRLRRGGLEVSERVLGPACDALNEAFFTFITAGRPLVTLKVAATLDGRIAASSGDSRWVTGEEARRRVHALRAQVDAVMVGAGTARADDPQLSARAVRAARQPARVIVEGREPLPSGLKVFTDRAAPTLLATCSSDQTRRETLAGQGVEVLACRPDVEGRIDLDDLLRQLAARGVVHVLCEGGARLAAALLARGLVDRLWLFLAPKLLGAGPTWLEGAPTGSMAEALAVADLTVERVGADLLLTGRLSARKAKAQRRPAPAAGRSALRLDRPRGARVDAPL